MRTTLLVATGGTIASRPTPEGVRVVLRGADLVAAAGIDPAGIDVLDIGHGPSWNFTPHVVESVARQVVDAAAAGDHDGVVVTHGTDTVEDTAFLAWLLGGAAACERCPIVFTAAMRHADHPGADGPANLRDATAVARSGALPGPVVRVHGTTHHARWVTKTDTTDLDTFRSPGASAADPTHPPRPPRHGSRVEPPVAQVQAHGGVDGDVIGWHLARGARGVVIEGTGAGNVNASLVAGIERAVDAGVPVVVTSRCWTGLVAPEYGGPGGGRFLADIGCIGGGDLPTHKARLALAVALGVDPRPEAVRAWFEELLGPT